MTDVEGIAREFHAALVARQNYQPPSARAALDLEQAYAVQRAFNRQRARYDAVAGFKAGISAAPAQQALGLAGPATGALFASGARTSGATIERGDYRGLVLETELGFRAARRIDKPIDTVDGLRAAIATVAPMFELADPGFGRAPIRGTDMIAANLACGGFVEGPRHALAGLDLNAVELRLARDGALLHTGRAVDLMGDHWQALRWLVNAVVAQGLVVEAGHLLLTGALGSAHPAVPGIYTADFTVLGTVSVTVV